MTKSEQSAPEGSEILINSIDPRTLSVGDGADGRPIWVAVDAVTQRVYRVYANGIATGFGDGVLTIAAATKSGTRQFEQNTSGMNMAVTEEEGASKCITLYELSGKVG